MLDSLVTYGALSVAGLAMAMVAFVVVKAWGPAARSRGGFWYLEAILLFSAPLTELLIFFYPEDLSGPFPVVARAVSVACVGLAIWALLKSATNARRGAGVIVAITFAYYLALVMSGIVGVTPGVPETYVTTPLLVIAFLVHGGFSLEWFLRAVRINLRIILALSLAAAIAMPLSAFNSEEARTLFGVARLEGITTHPNTLAAIAVVAIILEMRKSKSALWLTLAFIAIALAQSNTAWIALIIALAVMKGRVGQALRYIAAAGVILLSALVVLSYVSTESIWASVLGGDLTLNGRTRIWDAAMMGFAQYPIFGYGPDLLGPGFRDLYLPNFDAAGQAHNQFVQSLAGAGIVGLAALLVLFTVLILRSVKLRGLGDSTPLALVVALAIRSMTETPLRPTGAGLSTFLLIAVVAAVSVAWTERHSIEQLSGDASSSKVNVRMPSTRKASIK
jgi:O-antigen ligase